MMANAQESASNAVPTPEAPARLVAAEKTGALRVVPLGSTWGFKADPRDEGADQRWFSVDADVKFPRELQASPGGYKGQGVDFDGYCWYRQTFRTPTDLSRHKQCLLFFGSVDSIDSEVFLNGEKVFAHTMKQVCGTVIWAAPFFFDIKTLLKEGGENVLVVRAYNPCPGAGGITAPVFLVGVDQPVALRELHDYLAARYRLPPFASAWKFLAPSWLELPPLPPRPEDVLLGSRIQRTMTLLATSTQELRRTVKILFYGQSIVVGMKWRELIDDLRRQYPCADIIAENRAIGGNTAPLLVRYAQADLYPFYPDLVIFDVGGGELTGELERIVYNIRKFTTAEILMFPHPVTWTGSASNAVPATETIDTGTLYASYWRYLAQKYNAEFVDTYTEWKDYLTANKIPVNEMMGDTVHPNVHPNGRGYTLLNMLVRRHFRLNLNAGGGWHEQVRVYEARRAKEERSDEIGFTGEPWSTGKCGLIGRSSAHGMRLTFRGNRVDVVAFPVAEKLGTARILIDGRPPSAFPELYVATSVLKKTNAGVKYRGIRRVSVGPAPVAEDWMLRVKEAAADGKSYVYEVAGSVTGLDGAGTNNSRFVSKSGRIFMEAGDVVLNEAKAKSGDEFTWQVVFHGMDTWMPLPIKDPSREDAYTLAQGLSNQAHTLEIIPNGDGAVPVKEIIVYRPPIE